MKIGKAIRLARANRGLRQAELAKRLDVSPNYISLLENDHRDPSWRFVCRAADALDTPLPVLILLAADKPNEQKDSLSLGTELLRLIAALNR